MALEGTRLAIQPNEASYSVMIRAIRRLSGGEEASKVRSAEGSIREEE
jgi:hypothetical protein